MRPASLLTLAMTFGTAATAILGQSPQARADELLQNPGLDAPNGWTSNVTPAVDTSTWHSPGASLAAALDGQDPLHLRQTVAVTAGSTLAASVQIRSDIPATAELRLTFLDGGFGQVLEPSVAAMPVTAGAGFIELSLATAAPANAEWVEFAIRIVASGPGTAWVDTASLFETAPPTPTPAPPTPTAAPTHTPAPLPATPAPTTAAAPTATTTPPASATATTQAPPATPSSSWPQSPRGVRPGPPAAGSQPGPGPVAGGAGGLLANGGFEATAGGEPASWGKFGGEMYSREGGHSGARAVSFLSRSDSTKWMFQVVPVTPGEWYEFSAWAMRESGDGEAFLRLSFYSSGDGSGNTFAQADSATTTSATWTRLTTGPVQAPTGARSLRARLMIRPSGPFSAGFDDASLIDVPAPAATATAIPASPPPQATARPTTTRRPEVTPTPKPTATRRASAPTGRGISPAFLQGEIVAGGPTTLVINEILYDGDGDPDSAHEWIELHNPGAEVVALAGWNIADGNSSDPLPTTQVAPGGFVVIAASDYAGVADVVRLGDSRIGSGLNNGGDTVTLVDPAGAVIDQVIYGEGDAFTGTAGRTIGRDPDGAWLATLRPTPVGPNAFPEPLVAATPPIPAPTATPVIAAAAPTPVPQLIGAPAAGDQPPRESRGGTNPISWVILGAAGGAGILASLSGGRRYVSKYLEQRRAR